MATRLSSLLVGPIKKGKLAGSLSTTELLESAGYIRQTSSGVYNLLPLGLRVQRRIEKIVRDRLDHIGCHEVSLASLASSALWKRSGRFATSHELFKVDKDRYVLAATNEEEVTSLVGSMISSYRQLPLRLYQIGKKFRDEKRPRAGLLRGKEFTMKDLYSFDESKDGALATYDQIQEAYKQIFTEIGVPFVIAEADSGEIGGSQSHEYHYLSEAGEDHVVQCSSCKYTANIERATSPGKPLGTPGTASVQYFTSEDRNYLVAAYYPPDRILNPLLLKNEVENIDFLCKNPTQEYIRNSDPLSRRFIRLIDPRLTKQWDLPEPPIEVPLSRAQMTSLEVPLLQVAEADPCPSCGSPLRLSNAIEVAHTFYLGTKYSEPFGSIVKNAAGEDKTVEMGCYGIGISRLIGAIAESCRQCSMLRWPTSVAPFSAIIVTTDEIIADKIADQLALKGLSSIWDDRSNQFGVLLGNATSFGCPLTIIAGKRFKDEGFVELQTFTESTVCEAEEIGSAALQLWNKVGRTDVEN